MKVRIKFKKYGIIKFIGHLDVMRSFQKNFRRTGIDVAYSKGFSPHQLMSFSSPLGVGITSDGEYLDLTVNSITTRQDMMDKINSTSVEGIDIVDIVLLNEKAQNSMSIVKAADYVVSIRDSAYEKCENKPSFEEVKDKFDEFMTNKSIIVTKKTKKSEMDIDIRPLIYKYSFGQPLNDSVIEKYDNGIQIFMTISSGSNDNLKPELVMDAFCKFAGYDFGEYGFSYHRNNIYSVKEEVEDATHITTDILIPLSEVDVDHEQTDFYQS